MLSYALYNGTFSLNLKNINDEQNGLFYVVVNLKWGRCMVIIYSYATRINSK